jgi:hypothetical protein
MVQDNHLICKDIKSELERMNIVCLLDDFPCTTSLCLVDPPLLYPHETKH